MKFIIIILLMTLPKGHGDCPDSLLTAFWNLENFFDWRADSTSASTSDKEFSSSGSRHWTRKRFLAKCNAVSKTILWIADTKGMLPDVIGFAEVENRFVLSKLIRETSLSKLDYKIVHYDSPDPRGIDVALLYRSSRLRLLSSRPVHIRVPGAAGAFGAPGVGVPGAPGGVFSDVFSSGMESVSALGEDPPGVVMKTRDILLATFEITRSSSSFHSAPSGASDGATEGATDTIAFLVNHHPSKYGGSTQGRRIAALNILRSVTDSLQRAGLGHIVAMGDFNDTPDNDAFRILTDPPGILTSPPGGYVASAEGLVNLSLPLAAKGVGTIRFEGKWDLIDMFFVTSSLLGVGNASGVASGCRMEVVEPPFLTVRDTKFSGEKPFRTYSGPRYIGGVSDHRPILLKLPLPASSSFEGQK